MRLTCRYFGKALRSARALVVCVLIAQGLVFVCVPAQAQGQDPDDFQDDFAEVSRQIPQLAIQGETKKATALAERYVADARETNGEDDPEFATALSWLGWLYQKQDRSAEAVPLLEQALVIREQSFGPDHHLVATSLNNLAAVYYKQDREAEAKALTARANEARTKAVGLNVLEAFPRRFRELHWSGQEGEAAKLARRYVALARERYGADQPGVVPALLEAATLFEWQGNVPKAEALLKETLKIRTAAFGPRSPEVADSAFALGRLYATAGRNKQAERMLKRALSIRKAVYGSRDDKVVEATDALAGLYQKMGRKAEAEKLFEQSRKVNRRLAFMEVEPTYAVVKVYYATDRKNTGAADPAEVYAGDRGPLTLGSATVSIPRDHRAGAVETPSIWRLEWCNDPERFVVLLSVDELDQAQFFKDVSARVKDSAGKSAFIFVHGYNVTFTDAARRTAQMAYDLGFDGAPVFYSWPSQASYASYKVDETNAEWSRLDFKIFLKDFAAQSDAEHIYLVAHSMGTRVLTGALKELVLEDPSIRDKFDEIILAAPDIDADTFKRDIAPRILAGEAGTTLYASSGDYALMASKTFAGYRRAGDTAGGVTIAPGVDTIDASAIRTDFVGHSYYADSDSVLGDLRDLMLHGKRPDKRSRLSPVKTKDGRYWTFTEDQAPAQ